MNGQAKSKISKEEGRITAKGEWALFLTGSDRLKSMLERLESFLFERNGPLIAFWPMKSEPPVDSLLLKIHDGGRQVYLPAIVGRRELEFRRFEGVERMDSAGASLFQPDAGCRVLDEQPDRSWISLIPCLAVNREGARLGHGGGYYDRSVGPMGQAMRVALLPETLLNLPFPSASHDLRINHVITESRAVDYLS